MRELYEKISEKCSKMVTTHYSTSFSTGIFFLNEKLHRHIYAIYGFVRFADEIVDTFHDQDKKWMLDDFKRQTHEAIARGLSLNPILNSFQRTVNEFKVDTSLIDTFFRSMAMDIAPESYDEFKYREYILGSAEVVGLMCLKVFCHGNQKKYEELSFNAMKLGSAFQKINFLRDLNADYYQLNRVYFPGVDILQFNNKIKAEIEADIEQDFQTGYEGILKLPRTSRFGVYMAYVYYYALFQKIKATPADVILKRRIRIPNRNKYGLLVSSYFKHSFNLL